MFPPADGSAAGSFGDGERVSREGDGDVRLLILGRRIDLALGFCPGIGRRWVEVRSFKKKGGDEMKWSFWAAAKGRPTSVRSRDESAGIYRGEGRGKKINKGIKGKNPGGIEAQNKRLGREVRESSKVTAPSATVAK